MSLAPARAAILAWPLAALAAAVPAAAATWHVGLAAESGTPGGYVEVRENEIDGTPLQLRSDLGVTTVRNLRLSAERRLGDSGALRLSLGATDLTGSSVLRQTAYFNGVTLAPGPISSDTTYPDFWRLQAGYWRRVVRFGNGGGLWLSGSLSYVGLNFRINARVASDSAGHETKEDFITQELPIPLFGVHLRYPIAAGLSLFAGVAGGHIPWTNSLRREGGMVQLTQTNEDADLGFRYRFGGGWTARIYLYADEFQQNERSGEDGNFVRIDQHGFGIGVGRGF